MNRASHILPQKKFLPIIAILCFANCLNAQNDESAKDSTRVTAEINYFSRYIWRGLDLNDSHAVLQPSVSVSISEGFSIDVLGSLSLGGTHFNEVDVTLRYEKEILPEWFDMYAALSSNHYLSTEAEILLSDNESYVNNQEIALGLMTHDLPLDFSVEYGRGVSGINGDNTGNYLSASLEKEFDLDVLTMNSKISATYLDEYHIPSDITDISFENSFDIEAGSFTIQPNVRFVYLPSPQLLNDNDENHIFIFGLGLSRSW